MEKLFTAEGDAPPVEVASTVRRPVAKKSLATVAAGVLAALMFSVLLAPAAQASVRADRWWGTQTWFSRSEVRALAPKFQRMADIGVQGGGAAAGTTCAALGLMYVVPGLICGAVAGVSIWVISNAASQLNYAASTGRCARIDAYKWGVISVTPYSCNWG